MSDRVPLLEAQLRKTLESRSTQRVLLSGAEGVGRSHVLQQAGTAEMPVLRIECGRGRASALILRAMLSTSSTNEEVLWQVVQQAPQLASLEPDRKQLAAELLGSLVGIRRSDFRSHRLDEDARREGAFLELARWVTERALAGGLLLAFDDAHRCDDDGIALIELLSQQETPMPLCLVVSYDGAPERLSPAFRARRELWANDARWQQVTVRAPAPAAVVSMLTELGASGASAQALCDQAEGNPSLAMGLWRFWQSQPELAVPELPMTLDGLRVARVKLLGEDVARAAATLAVLGGVAPLAALATIDPGLPLALQRASIAGLVTFERRGPLEVCRFTDVRVVPGLGSGVSSAQSLGIKVTAGAWAAEALEQLEPDAFGPVADVLVPLAGPALDGTVASVWLEAWAGVAPGRAEAAARLESALVQAHGVRRLVLLRRLAELKLFLGHSEEALASLQTVGRTVMTNARQPRSRALDILAAQPLGVLDRWDTLTPTEALLAIELTKGECLSHLLRREETEKIFHDLEQRLGKLSGGAATHLWIRWARSWSWFLCEVLGRAADAVKACAMVRQKAAAADLVADEDALGFVRAQEIACVSIGDFTRARQLADELITLAERGGRLRDVCLAWNARAILHFGQGELVPARRAFEKAIEMARTTAWTRREAISSHNLALVLTELGELDAAHAIETQYAKLSVLIGNHAAKVEAPLVLANVELSRGDLTSADALLTTARKLSETNGWAMMVATVRSLSGRLRLLRYRANGDTLELTKAKNDFLASLEVLEEHSTAWTEELDPGEVYALYAATLKLNGQTDAAKAALARGQARMPSENIVSQKQMAVARAYVDGVSIEPALEWFAERSFERRVGLWRLLM